MTSGQIPKISSEQFLANLDEAMQWMQSLGVKISEGRMVVYRQAAQTWADLLKYGVGHAEEAVALPNITSAAFEVPAFLDIHQAFKNEKPSKLGGLAATLKKAVQGPTDLPNETHDNSAARNFLFEAITAAKVHNPEKGIRAILNAPSDTGFELGQFKVWVECKRMASQQQLRPRIAKACEQLTKTLIRHPHIRQRGLVAVDISKLITPPPPQYVFNVPRESEITVHAGKMIDKYIEDHWQEWENEYVGKDARIIGTILRLQLIVTSEDRGTYVHAVEWGLTPRRGIRGDDYLRLGQLAALLNYGNRSWGPALPSALSAG
jgi:hypothetical protein